MSKEEIVEWTSHGIEFGAHSHTHPELDCISADGVHGEVEGSRQVLEELCRSPVVAFAYPYGSYNAEVRNIVARSFRLAVTTEEGMNTLGIVFSNCAGRWCSHTTVCSIFPPGLGSA